MRKQIICLLITLTMLLSAAGSPASAQQSPQTISAGELFSISAVTGDTSGIQWSLKRNNADVPLTNYINGTLTGEGGQISFRESGSYSLTALVSDATGREFSSTKNITVLTPLNCDFSVPSTNHIGAGITVTMDIGAQAGDKTILWSLTKSGSTVDYNGTLNNSGGSIFVADTGSYILTAEIKDDEVTLCSASRSFTIYNNPPSVPVITRTPSNAIVGNNTYVTINANATDPDGDTVSYTWINRPNETSRYSIGTHTVICIATDQWGMSSDEASTIFKSKADNISTTANITQNRTDAYLPLDQEAIYCSYSVSVEPVTGHIGSDSIVLYGLNKNTAQWDTIRTESCTNGITLSGIIDLSIYSSLNARFFSSETDIYNKTHLRLAASYAF